MIFTGRVATDHGMQDHVDCEYCEFSAVLATGSHHIPDLKCARCKRKQGDPVFAEV